MKCYLRCEDLIFETSIHPLAEPDFAIEADGNIQYDRYD